MKTSQQQSNRCYCELCHKSFVTKFSYKSHYNNIHLQIKRFVCDYKDCGKQFVTKYRLDIHKLNQHQGIRRYACSICGKTFTEKGILKTHQSIHTDERKFKCSCCGRCYKTISPLYSHIKISHLNERKYKCQICNKSFGKTSSLKRHILLHTKKKIYNDDETISDDNYERKFVQLKEYRLIKEISFCVLAC